MSNMYMSLRSRKNRSQGTSSKPERESKDESSWILSGAKRTLYINYLLMPVLVIVAAGLLTYFAAFKKTDLPTVSTTKDTSKPKEVLLTAEELAKHDGSDPDIPIYLAVLGRVYNVEKGRRHYQVGSGYNVFAGRDSSPSFVTGVFEREKATDDVKGLTPEEMLGVKEWLDFYRKDYTYVGKLIGRYYDHEGNPTQAWKEAKIVIKEGQRLRKLQQDENKRFPGCNSKWSADEGSMIWCSTNSAGIQREWAGVPRKMFKPGKKDSKCVCIRTSGPASDTGDGNQGDLNNPSMQEYPGCGKYDVSCKIES